MPSKRLILRLSSLGDVILASSALEVDLPHHQIHWVVAQEYQDLLLHHPKINRVLAFNRSSDSNKFAEFKRWVRFCRELWEFKYDEIFDLHQSLRTKSMKILFRIWSATEKQPFPKWKSISKARWKLFPYFFFKSLWPKKLRPIPWVERFSRVVGGTGNERPNLMHLIRGQDSLDPLIQSFQAGGKKYICVMPSSRWNGKKWSTKNYLAVLKRLPYFPVILGKMSDRESLELVKELEAEKVPHFSGVEKWNFRQTAYLLKNSAGYLGGDTGLAHLAEAVGVGAYIIFGPTKPDMGFGPWRESSRSIGQSLWCRPCGKDGRACFRITRKYLCLKELSPKAVLKAYGDL